MLDNNKIIFISYVISIFLVAFCADNIIDDMHQRTMDLMDKNDQQDNIIQELKKQMNLIEYDVTVTMYNPVKSQCDDTPNITADGTRINPRKASQYRYVALSRDLLTRWGGPFNYGDYVILEGAGKNSGVYKVKDTMNPRITRTVDILKTPGAKLFKYTDVKLYKHNNADKLLFASR